MTFAAPPNFFDSFKTLIIGTGASGDCLLTLPMI